LLRWKALGRHKEQVVWSAESKGMVNCVERPSLHESHAVAITEPQHLGAPPLSLALFSWSNETCLSFAKSSSECSHKKPPPFTNFKAEI